MINLIVGIVLMVLATFCIVAGIFVGVAISLRDLNKSAPTGSGLPYEKIVQEALKLLGKMLVSPGGIFFVVGLILYAGAFYVLHWHPF